MSIQLHNITSTINQAQLIAAIQAAMQNEDVQAIQRSAERQNEARIAEREVTEANQTENERIREDESGGGAVAGGVPRRAKKRGQDKERQKPATAASARDPRRGKIIDVRI